MKLSDFDFDLPEGLIATRPVRPRPTARLLHVEGGTMADRHVSDLIDILRPGDRLILNNTRVIPARLFGERQRETRDGSGRAKVEVTLIGPASDGGWRALARPLRKLAAGDRVVFSEALSAVVRGKDEAEAVLDFTLSGSDFDAALDAAGRMPLPPYIEFAPRRRCAGSRGLSDRVRP